MRPPLVRVSRVAGGDPRDVRAVGRLGVVERRAPRPAGSAPAGGKARATITFAVVKRVCPFGKPAGIVYPVGSKNGWPGRPRSSMIPIFIPCASGVERRAPERRRADLRPGVAVERRSVRPALVHVADARDRRAAAATSARGSETAKPFATSRYRQCTRADGRSRASARLNDALLRSIRAREPGASASAGEASVTTTSVRSLAAATRVRAPSPRRTPREDDERDEEGATTVRVSRTEDVRSERAKR